MKPDPLIDKIAQAFAKGVTAYHYIDETRTARQSAARIRKLARGRGYLWRVIDGRTKQNSLVIIKP